MDQKIYDIIHNLGMPMMVIPESMIKPKKKKSALQEALETRLSTQRPEPKNIQVVPSPS